MVDETSMSGVARGVASVADRPIRLGPTTTPGRRRIPRSRRRQRRGAHTQRQRFAAPRSCRPPWSRTTAGPRSRSAGRSKAVRTFRHGVENGGSIVRERARRRVRYSISGGLGEPVPPREVPRRRSRNATAPRSPRDRARFSRDGPPRSTSAHRQRRDGRRADRPPCCHACGPDRRSWISVAEASPTLRKAPRRSRMRPNR